LTANNNKTAIRATGLIKRFGPLVAVDNLSLEVARGEAFALVGPDGAGKTTTMRLLCGIMDPDGGRAEVLGFDTVRESERIKESIGFMPQRFGLYDDLTVAENISFYADIYRVPRAERQRRMAELLEFSRKNGFQIRFIEYMDVGNSNNWVSDGMVSKHEILERINSLFPLEEGGRDDDSAPSMDYRFKDGLGNVGVIASVTEPFCTGCTRARLTADGRLVLCLFSDQGFDLKKLIRAGATDADLISSIRTAWTGREDRYSEERLEAMNSGEYKPNSKKKIEMISLGG
jgi:hypothetical protein